MDFAFSEEQQMLKEGAASYLAAKAPPERVVELASSERGWDPDLWAEMAGLGWIGLSSPEEAGGAGMTFLEEAVLFEELGFSLLPGPFFSTVALALPALVRSPEALARITSGEAAATLAWSEPDGARSLADVDSFGCKAEEANGGWLLNGAKYLVPDLAATGYVVVVARGPEGVGLWLTEGGERSASNTVDSTRRLGAIRFAGTEASLLAAPDEAASIIDEIRLRALSAASLEAVGIAQKALDLAREHASAREQFGKPIGTYQAVSHQVADTYVDVELARSLAYWAAWTVATSDAGAAAAAAAAKSLCADAAVAACERSIQVHGGIGFTWEHLLHRYYKRAQWIASFEGPGAVHRAAVAGRIF